MEGSNVCSSNSNPSKLEQSVLENLEERFKEVKSDQILERLKSQDKQFEIH